MQRAVYLHEVVIWSVCAALVTLGINLVFIKVAEFTKLCHFHIVCVSCVSIQNHSLCPVHVLSC